MIDFDINRDKGLKVHFIGIGGISMSGLAEILLHYGYKVSGSDWNPSHITERLSKKGAQIFVGHNPDNITGADLVVYTAAVKKDNPEYLKALELNIPLVDRAEFLGQLMKQYKHRIAIAGTHGKTTTTSLLSIIIKNTDLDPTLMIGGEVDMIGGSALPGNGDIFVTEACEYVESFLRLFPNIGIILNIDADHLDYYRNIDHIISSFSKFTNLIPEDGYIIASADDKNTLRAIEGTKSNLITFGIDSKADWTASNISYDSNGCGQFDVYHKGSIFGTFKLNIPGRHNISNALSAIACAEILNIDKNIIKESFEEFCGTRRRFEKKGEFNGVSVIDDYAHHPTEIKATLSAAKNYPHNKLWCVFQPHTYSRTLKLLSDFSKAFDDADELIVTDIYAARETDTGEISSLVFSDKVRENGVNVKYIPSFNDIEKYLRDNVSPGDVIITMGAGDVYKIGDLLLGK